MKCTCTPPVQRRVRGIFNSHSVFHVSLLELLLEMASQLGRKRATNGALETHMLGKGRSVQQKLRINVHPLVSTRCLFPAALRLCQIFAFPNL